MEGLRISCLYSLGCPELKELGKSCQEAVEEFVLGRNPYGDDVSFFKKIMKLLDPFYFYQYIALANKRSDFFSEEVVRSHWLLGRFLSPVTSTSIDRMMREAELPESSHRALKLLFLIRGLTGGKVHHNFVVLRQAKGISGIPDFLLAEINGCLVRAGRITKRRVVENKIYFTIDTFSLGANRLSLMLRRITEVVEGSLVLSAKEGDYVSLHLGRAREILDKHAQDKLVNITNEALAFSQTGHL